MILWAGIALCASIVLSMWFDWSFEVGCVVGTAIGARHPYRVVAECKGGLMIDEPTAAYIGEPV
jgi:hypothetical protein